MAARVLLVGSPQSCDGALRGRLADPDLRPLVQTSDIDESYALAAMHAPVLVIVDFSLSMFEMDVVADALRAVAPQAWILDSSGLVRRRPDHAEVSFSHTHPLVLASH